MITNLGTIRIEQIEEEYEQGMTMWIRATLDIPQIRVLDGIEGEGKNLSEALLDLHEQVEASDW
jgi:hypothetical protein